MRELSILGTAPVRSKKIQNFLGNVLLATLCGQFAVRFGAALNRFISHQPAVYVS